MDENTSDYLLYSMFSVLYLSVRFVLQTDSSARGFYSMFYMLIADNLGLWFLTYSLAASSVCGLSLYV